jgi:hypothetical protein
MHNRGFAEETAYRTQVGRKGELTCDEFEFGPRLPIESSQGRLWRSAKLSSESKTGANRRDQRQVWLGHSTEAPHP